MFVWILVVSHLPEQIQNDLENAYCFGNAIQGPTVAYNVQSHINSIHVYMSFVRMCLALACFCAFANTIDFPSLVDHQSESWFQQRYSMWKWIIRTLYNYGIDSAGFL